MNHALRFDEATHTYWLGDESLPSVTRIIEAAGLVELHGSAEQLDYARDRGTALHMATELDDRGELDEDSVADDIRGHLAAWRRFRAESGIRIDAIECRLYHPRLRYAGTIDRIGTLQRRRAIIDIKTGAERRATGVQLAAYEAMAKHAGLCASGTRRYGCYLSDDGNYKLVPYTDTRDLLAFCAALSIFRWRTNA